MKKVVVKLNFQDEKSKQKAMKAVSSIGGVTSVAIDPKDNKITVIGEVDPVQVANKLRKWYPQIDTVGPVKEEKKDDKKDGGGDKKKEGGGGDDKKDGGGDKKKEEKDLTKEQIATLVAAYKNYYPHYTPYYSVHSVEEDPNACVIC